MHFGWSGTISNFLEVTEHEWLQSLKSHYPFATRGEYASASQVQAWRDSFAVLQTNFSRLLALRPSSADWHCIFEYELPREGGRRPDLVVLAQEAIIVVEFKEKTTVDRADIDQVRAYARDIASYHEKSHGLPVHALLVPTKSELEPALTDDVLVVPAEHLTAAINNLVPQTNAPPIDANEWLEADYAPLPYLITAARHIFENDPLPYIKRAHAEAQIPATLHYIQSVVEQARRDGERHLVLLTGAPGAGKTLVGLQFVHQMVDAHEGGKSAVFLSGNGPLVEVLQHALKSRVFVQDVHRFVKQYGMNHRVRTPMEHVLVFDEAQRAWSRKQVMAKHGKDASEPDIFVQIAERLPGWAVVIGLIGEGQEIHVGEEAGIDQWNDALKQGQQPWRVHLPPNLTDRFSAARSVHATPLLNLTTSLRTHVARDVQEWVAALLSAKIEDASRLSRRMRSEGFDLYITRSFEDACQYVRDRYEGHPFKRYGLLASSKPSRSIVDQLAVARDFQSTKRIKFGPWYNDPPESPLSCCQLTSAVTEFGCQGLELDMPIICWGEDLWWTDSGWDARKLPRDAVDPYQLRINAYRVLLSRGRDGFVIWVPPISQLDQTFMVLQQAGTSLLPAPSVARGA